jgi:DNA uptake protein ComE-like DNA-binding protein
MNKSVVRAILILTLGFACGSWSLAQAVDAEAKPKPSPKVRSDSQVKAQTKQRADQAKAKVAEVAKALDLNHASKANLMRLPGMTGAYADAIIAKRPFKTKADLVVKNAIPMDLYQTLRKQVKVAAN